MLMNGFCSFTLSGLDLVPLCVTFLLCFWEVQYGIMAGVLVSAVLLLYPIARPKIKVCFITEWI